MMRRATLIWTSAAVVLLAGLAGGGTLLVNAQAFKVTPVSEGYARSLLAKGFDGAFADAPLQTALQRRSVMAPDGEYLMPLGHPDLSDHIALQEVDPAARATLTQIAARFPTAEIPTDIAGFATSETADPTAILTLFVAADGTTFIHAGDY